MIIENFTTFRWMFATSKVSFDAASGYETWPTAKLRSGGFTGLALQMTGIEQGFPLRCTANNVTADANPLISEYDWYVSQRTDDPAQRYLAIASPSGFSGTIEITPTALGAARFPGTSEASLMHLFRRCQVYVQRRSDQAIQWADLYAFHTGVPGY